MADVDDIAAALNALVMLDVHYLRKRSYPPLYRSGVRYQTEGARHREDWQTVPRLYSTLAGDCEDVACARVAELRVSGEDPDARPLIKRSSVGFHILVRRGDGSEEDPSRILGMGRRRRR